MKTRSLILLLSLGVLLAFAIAAIPGQSVYAQKCYNNNQTEVPCPKDKEKKKQPTETPVPTNTATPQADALLPPPAPNNPPAPEPNSGPALPGFFDFGGGINLPGLLIGLLVGILIGMLVPAVFRRLRSSVPGALLPGADNFHKSSDTGFTVDIQLPGKSDLTPRHSVTHTTGNVPEEVRMDFERDELK